MRGFLFQCEWYVVGVTTEVHANQDFANQFIVIICFDCLIPSRGQELVETENLIQHQQRNSLTQLLFYSAVKSIKAINYSAHNFYEGTVLHSTPHSISVLSWKSKSPSIEFLKNHTERLPP